MHNPPDIARLIADRILGKELSAEETLRLDTWLGASPENAALFERIRRGEAMLQILDLERKDYGSAMAAKFLARKAPSETRHARRRLYARSGVAAAALALAVLTFTKIVDMPRPESGPLAHSEIVPGKVHAVLTLSDGRTIDIAGAKTGGGQEEDARNVYEILTGAFTGELPGAEEKEPEYYTLSVPAGGEFFFTLPDSSKVWLNSKTELRFPRAFSGRQRHVYLKGEAFFEVSANKDKAFVVSLSGGDVTVYGTRFSVTDYDGGPVSAVLVEGSIGFVSKSGKSARLNPSQRMVYEESADRVSVETVDVAPYTAWTYKMFIFKAQRLDEIMATLGRWYDVEIMFGAEALKGIRLSGQLYRYEDIRILLNTYEEAAGIKFGIEGKRITITQK